MFIQQPTNVFDPFLTPPPSSNPDYVLPSMTHSPLEHTPVSSHKKKSLQGLASANNTTSAVRPALLPHTPQPRRLVSQENATHSVLNQEPSSSLSKQLRSTSPSPTRQKSSRQSAQKFHKSKLINQFGSDSAARVQKIIEKFEHHPKLSWNVNTGVVSLDGKPLKNTSIIGHISDELEGRRVVLTPAIYAKLQTLLNEK